MAHPPPPGEPDQPPSPYERPAGEPPAWGPPAGEQPPSYGPPGEYGPRAGQPGPPGDYGPPPGPHGPAGPHGYHGAPGHYGPPGWGGPARGTNVLAILSLVFAFVFSPAGIVLGYLAKRQIRQTGEEGDQLATWGLILGYVFTALGLLACCGWIAFAFWAGSNPGHGY
ncbi:DUF4190 domain-containing protein [Micromonospora sp. PLK6-60]|uniref:DUF4190 domain-containing protein n=1 Tax=Micromonospora sp. PLK6-60 TaxID=2873383 RepID=UPI001CA6DBEF|nr:DUF4190 domain-containing protein [Micromonospora sp. PLK6-60]MBY8871617.1 DUF4190 domain-containing protein [Micromonospora sp. PLK6-60]